MLPKATIPLFQFSSLFLSEICPDTKLLQEKKKVNFILVILQDEARKSTFTVDANTDTVIIPEQSLLVAKMEAVSAY